MQLVLLLGLFPESFFFLLAGVGGLGDGVVIAEIVRTTDDRLQISGGSQWKPSQAPPPPAAQESHCIFTRRMTDDDVVGRKEFLLPLEFGRRRRRRRCGITS